MTFEDAVDNNNSIYFESQ